MTNNSVTDAQPHWSPDGAKLLVTSDRDAPGTNFEVYVMNANGTGVTRLTTDPAGDSGRVVVTRWTKIVFAVRP